MHLATAQAPVKPKPPMASAEFVESQATADEPVATEFSFTRAAQSLDAGAIHFTQQHRCVQCHANLMYLAARPAVEKALPTPPDMRRFYEWIVETRWPEYGVIYDAWSKDQPAYQAEGVKLPATEPIVVAFGLAMNDRATTGKLHGATRAALAMVMARQRADGGFNAVTDGLASQLGEFDQTVLAAIAVGSAPEDFALTEEAQACLARIRTYFVDRPAASTYQRGMLLWAAARVADLVTDSARDSFRDELLTRQRADGGWCLAELLHDDEAAKTGTSARERPSDGYGTGFALFTLRQANVPADHAALVRGIGWLKSNQRESGRWFQPSFVGRPNHLISNSATAWAVMGLEACGEIP